MGDEMSVIWDGSSLRDEEVTVTVLEDDKWY